LKTGKYNLPADLKKIFTSTELKDIQAYDGLRNSVGSF
jgi:hypothetical protein